MFSASSSGRDLARLAGLAAAYFLTGKLGLLLAIPPGYATAIWPPSGIALAGLLILGDRFWPGIVLGSFLVNIGVAFDGSSSAAILRSLAVAAAIGSGAALQALAGTRLIRRRVGFPKQLDDERDIVRFLLLGGPLACLVNASWSVGTLFLAGSIAPDNLLFTWWTWWVGDTIGVLIVTPMVLIWLAPSFWLWRRRRLSMTLPLCATFALAVAFFFQASTWEQDRIRRDFFRQADAITGALQAEIDKYLEVLHAVQDFHIASPSFAERDFRFFVSRPLARHPGILALSWNPRIGAAERARFEDEVRRADADFRISERNRAGELVAAGQRDEYVPVRYIEPHVANRQALGYDVASEPVRAAALARARDSGRAAATGRLRLVQDAPDGSPGLLVFLPVYRPGPPTLTPEERRRRLQGFVVAVLRLSDLIAAAVKSREGREMAIAISDLNAPPASRLLYASHAGRGPADGRDEAAWTAGREAGMLRQKAIAVADRQWQVGIAPTPEYLVRHRSWQAWSVLVAGMLFTSLLGAFLLILTGRAGRVEMLVEQRTRQLAEANQLLIEEVALRKASEAALQQKNVQLAQASQAKDLFLATMSHELRTPLNAILGFTGTLLMRLAGPLTADQEKQLQTVQGSASHLLSLINDLLDVAKIESGEVELRLQPVSCVEVVDEVAKTLQALAEKKGLQFRLALPAGNAMVRTDRRALAQIVINLVNNAIKFTDRGSVSIELEQQRAGEQTVTAIRVADTGCGIRPEDQERIFEAFTQIDPSSTRRHEGTGLGLHLSRRLAELLGGRILCRSEYGRGSVFTLEIVQGAAAEG